MQITPKVILALALAMPALAATAHSQAAPAAVLTGAIRDSAGAPVASAEIFLRESGKDIRSLRANDRGEFTLGDVVPGTYVVWFRRLGYASEEFNWAARGDHRDTVTVLLRAIPRGLSPVVIREREDQLMRGSASLLGLVVDADGKAVEEASVDLIGADRGGETRANGGFLFKPLPLGPYVVRVRKIGYEPQMVTMNLQDGEDREVIVRLRPLATTIDAVNIMSASGYGAMQQSALADLDKRLRWRGTRNVVLGPDDLLHYEGLSLDYASRFTGIGVVEAMKAHRTASRHIDPRGTASTTGSNLFTADDDACMLINGLDFELRPLSSYNVNDIEMLEIYPSRSEDSRTVSFRMHGACMENPDGSHPTWYVLWLKGRK